MSKKSRKKSSHSSARPRTSPASKPGKSATNRQTGSPFRGSSRKSASKALKVAAKKTVRGTQKTKTLKTKTSKSKTSKSKASKSKASGSSKRSAGPSAAGRTNLVEGAHAPEFSLLRDGGGTVSLSDFIGRRLVLFFYPRADTPGCTREAIDFTRLASAFEENRTSVVGVSADPIKAQEAFRNKHKLSIPLASDEQHHMLAAYGAWGEKSMYGRTFEGILRTTFLIGADGRIIRIWRHVKVDGHAEEVLAAARASEP
jgi:thioredoxin-dependent peroxiredoxin